MEKKKESMATKGWKNIYKKNTNKLINTSMKLT